MLRFPPRLIIEVVEDGRTSIEVLLGMRFRLELGLNAQELAHNDYYVPQPGRVHRIALFGQKPNSPQETSSDLVRSGILAGYGRFPLVAGLLLIEAHEIRDLECRYCSFVHEQVCIPRPNKPNKDRAHRLVFSEGRGSGMVTGVRVRTGRPAMLSDHFAFAVPS
ncbi:MAG: hypothetical protein QOE22_644 [Candidatus Parcubacteria bacterium]|jgi:hypothetical protein|nr:hypothetical protein [Candidatus Parcubacteria bacterium]